MPNLNKYSAVIPFTLHGIPCQIGLLSFDDVQGSYSYNAPSDLDYYGYTECEYDILDRKGYHAKWLEAKGVDYDDVVEAVREYYADEFAF